MDNLDEKKFTEQLETKFSKLDETLKGLQAEGATKSELQKVQDAMKAQGETLLEIKESHKSAIAKGFDAQLGSFLTANKEKIKEIYKSGKGHLEFYPDQDEINKVVGDVMRANGLIGSVPAYNDVNLPFVNLRDDNPMLAFASTQNTNSASIPFTEITGWEGNAAAVAEGGLKPQVDFDWVTNYATPFKAAAYEVLSEEVVDDIPRIMSVAKDFLKQKHDLKKVDLVYFGSGVVPNPKGATIFGSENAYATGVATPFYQKITHVNIMDIIYAAVMQVYGLPPIVDGIPFIPNLVMMNHLDFVENFVMVKDVNGLPLYPTASLFSRVTMGGVTIVPWVKVPADKLFLADMSKYNLTNYKPYFIKIGWVNDQLIRNMFTIVGESRFHAYVKNYEVDAFMYADISTIRTNITKP